MIPYKRRSKSLVFLSRSAIFAYCFSDHKAGRSQVPIPQPDPARPRHLLPFHYTNFKYTVSRGHRRALRDRGPCPTGPPPFASLWWRAPHILFVLSGASVRRSVTKPKLEGEKRQPSGLKALRKRRRGRPGTRAEERERGEARGASRERTPAPVASREPSLIGKAGLSCHLRQPSPSPAVYTQPTTGDRKEADTAVECPCGTRARGY